MANWAERRPLSCVTAFVADFWRREKGEHCRWGLQVRCPRRRGDEAPARGPEGAPPRDSLDDKGPAIAETRGGAAAGLVASGSFPRARAAASERWARPGLYRPLSPAV